MNHLPNLLIVDDNRDSLRLLEIVIRKINVNIIKALSGTEALEKTRGIKLALAIIDVRMPKMSGFEVAIEINKGRQGSEVPVIFLTASEFNETDLFNGYDSGAVDYIFKPVNNNILLSKIKVFIDLFIQKQTIVRNVGLLKESSDELIKINDDIRKSEAKVTTFFDKSPVGSVIVGLDRYFIRCNATFCNFVGYTEDELTGKTFSDITHPEDIELGMKEMEQILAEEIESFYFEKRYISKDGNILWAGINVNLFHGVNNEILYYLSTVQDITRRRLAEEGLTISRSLLRASMESQKETILVSIDRDYRYLYFNTAHWDSMKFVYNQDVKLGMNILDCISSDDDRKIAKENYDRALMGESHMNVRKYGDIEFIWYESFFNPILNDKKEIIGATALARDVTGRLHKEEKLRQLNEELEDRVNERTAELLKSNSDNQQTRLNYETFFNTIDDFLFVLDERGDVIHTNTTVIDRLGYTSEEIIGKSVFMFHPTERREEASRIVSEILNGITDSCPVPIITKSGIQIPVETRVSHGFWDGKPVIFGVTKDISKIKLSEEKFSKLFYLNPSACGLSDLADNKYIEVNEAFSTLLGYDKDEVIGTSASALGILSPEAKNTILNKADENGKIKDIEVDLKAKNGDIKYVLLSAENIKVQDKSYRFTVAQDITKRKLAEEALQFSEVSLAKAQQIAHIGSWTLDDTTHELWWSDETFRIFGFVPGAFTPSMEVFSQSVHPEDQSFLNEAIKTAWDQRSIFNIEHRIILPDGEERLAFEQAEVLCDMAGHPKKWMGTVQDITEKKQVQKKIIKAIIQTEEKERAYFSKELHDGLGPLLSTIKLYLQWSQRPKSNKSQDEIIKEAQGILDEVIASVKEISNKLSPHILANFGLTSAIQSFVDHLTESLPISISFQSNLIRRLDNDIETTLYRAIIECINNTIKHARANEITITLNDFENELQIRYTDDGVGFDYEEKLSDHNGLGLFNLLNRIKNIGGRITMFSKPGEGVDYEIVVI